MKKCEEVFKSLIINIVKNVLLCYNLKNNVKKRGKSMKKKIILALVCAMLLGGCGISQEDYDAIIQEKSSLEEQVNSLKTENEALKAENEEINSKYLKLEEEKKERTEKELAFATTYAWAVTSFGEDTIILKEDQTYLQIIGSDSYDLSQAGFAKLWSTMQTAILLLGQYKQEIQYDKIAIKFVDSNKKEIIEFTLKKDGDAYTLEEINGDLTRSSSIVPYLEQIAN